MRCAPVAWPAVVAGASALVAAACGGEAPPPSTAASRTRSPSPAGTLEPRAVLTALRGNEASLHACFDLGATDAKSVLRLRWRVDPSGVARSAEVEKQIGALPIVGQCLGEQIESLHFGERESPAEARWTFVSRLFVPPPPDEEKAKHRGSAKKSAERESQEHEKGVSIESSSPGFMEPRAVDDIVEANFGLFAHCYRSALERHPGLSGVVRLRFVIGADGSVASVRDAGSELDDGPLVNCVAEGFYALSFPQAPGREVRVLYRLLFDSGSAG